MPQLFANNAYSSLGATFSAVATSLTLATGHGARFPTPTGSDYFLLTLVGLDSNGNENAWEIVKVTGRASDALTVVRAQEGTTAALWAAGTRVELRATSATFGGLLQTTGGTLTGSLAMSGSGLRIIGDFSNATVANRLGLQTSAANSATSLAIIPSGTGTGAHVTFSNSSDPDNAAYCFIGTGSGGGEFTIQASKLGTGSYIPVTIRTGGVERLRIDTAGVTSLTGNLAFTGAASRIVGDFSTATLANRLMFQTSTVNSASDPAVLPNGTNTTGAFSTFNNSDPTNASFAQMSARAAEIRLMSAISGTGTYLPMTFWTGGSERARLDAAGNLLVGKTAPFNSTTDIGTFERTHSAATNLVVSNQQDNAAASANLSLQGYGGGAALSVPRATPGTNPLIISLHGTERARFDSAGNFGLGVTPSAWNSTYRAIDIAGGSISGRTSTSNQVDIASNAYRDGPGNWLYKFTGPAVRFAADGSSGGYQWFTAPSGTAGNLISFTQAAQIASSGVFVTYAGFSVWNGTSGAAGAFSFSAPSNGNLRIFDDYAGVEVARFSSGNLNINTTGAAGNRLYVVQSGAGNVAARFQNSSNNFASNNIYSVLDGAGNATTAANHFVAFASGADVLAIRGNGNVVNTNNSYGAISDLKLKDNIVDVTPKLAKLLQVRIVNYTLKADSNKTKLMGVIAQELEQISPGLIEETPDYEEVKKTREVEVPAVDAVLDAEGNEVTPAVPATTRTEEYTERVATGTTTKSVKYSVFVPMLIKGMQEQQTHIESLQSQLDTQNTAMQLLVARLEALEAK